MMDIKVLSVERQGGWKSTGFASAEVSIKWLETAQMRWGVG